MKFKLFVEKSKQQEIIDFICGPHPDLSSDRSGSTFVPTPPSLKAARYRQSVRDDLVDKLDESCSLFAKYENLPHKYFIINDIGFPKDPALFFNRKLTYLATSFMKKIQQDLIAIFDFLDISFQDKPAVANEILVAFKQQGLNYYISQSSNQATIKCSNRNIFVNIDALKRSKYFRLI